MKIRLCCPFCGEELQDPFGAASCRVVPVGQLQLECFNCQKTFCITIKYEVPEVNAMERQEDYDNRITG
jgi:hypothetical protein